VVFEWSGVGMGFEWVIFGWKWGLSWCFLGFDWVVLDVGDGARFGKVEWTPFSCNFRILY
jgi:hypothetical protein